MADRRIEGNFSQGWGIAALVTLLAVACFVGAFLINRATHYSPTDTLAPARGAPTASH
jgi:hypothetical protein